MHYERIKYQETKVSWKKIEYIIYNLPFIKSGQRLKIFLVWFLPKMTRKHTNISYRGTESTLKVGTVNKTNKPAWVKLAHHESLVMNFALDWRVDCGVTDNIYVNVKTFYLHSQHKIVSVACDSMFCLGSGETSAVHWLNVWKSLKFRLFKKPCYTLIRRHQP